MVIIVYDNLKGAFWVIPRGYLLSSTNFLHFVWRLDVWVPTCLNILLDSSYLWGVSIFSAPQVVKK